MKPPPPAFAIKLRSFTAALQLKHRKLLRRMCRKEAGSILQTIILCLKRTNSFYGSVSLAKQHRLLYSVEILMKKKRRSLRNIACASLVN